MYITAGVPALGELSAEDEAKLAASEYEKTDSAIKELFGTLPENLAVITETDNNDNNGGGEAKLLIIKDSYANTFSQFVVDDYAETHLIDMRFFRNKLSDYIKENGITEVLVLYNIPNFCEDAGLARCAY